MTTLMTGPNSLGTLIKLPRELRDQIYDHVFERSYLVLLLEDFYRKRYAPDLDFKILCTSKALNAEASDCVFSKRTTFKFCIDFNPHLPRPPPFVMPKRRERWANIEFEIQTMALIEGNIITRATMGLGLFNKEPKDSSKYFPMVTAAGGTQLRQTIYHPRTVDPICKATVDHFAKAETERNNLLITFTDFGLEFNLFMATRFFQTLKMCTGFRTITVVLIVLWSMIGSPSKTEVTEKAKEVQEELESCWGTCVVTDVIDRCNKNRKVEARFAFELVFQPLEFHGTNLKAEAASAIKTAGRVEEFR